MPKPKPLKILNKTYRSVSEAAQSLCISKASLFKIIKASKTQKDIENAINLARERKLGYHEKSVEINEKIFIFEKCRKSLWCYW